MTLWNWGCLSAFEFGFVLVCCAGLVAGLSWICYGPEDGLYSHVCAFILWPGGSFNGPKGKSLYIYIYIRRHNFVNNFFWEKFNKFHVIKIKF
jgi:hypothetical protein